MRLTSRCARPARKCVHTIAHNGESRAVSDASKHLSQLSQRKLNVPVLHMKISARAEPQHPIGRQQPQGSQLIRCRAGTAPRHGGRTRARPPSHEGVLHPSAHRRARPRAAPPLRGRPRQGRRRRGAAQRPGHHRRRREQRHREHLLEDRREPAPARRPPAEHHPRRNLRLL